MNKFRKLLFGLVAALIFPLVVNGAFYKYSDLMLKDLEQMQKAVNERVERARALSEQASLNETEADSLNQEAIANLADGLKLILSRPDTDNMVNKLMPLVHRPLSDHSAFVDTLNLLVAEGLHGLTQKNLDVVTRTTYYYILTNIMGEFAPILKREPEIKAVFIKIQKADVDLPTDLVQHRRMRTMETSTSPSITAQNVLHREFPEEFKEKKKSWWKFW